MSKDIKAKLGSFGNPIKIESLEKLKDMKRLNWVEINGRKEFLHLPFGGSTNKYETEFTSIIEGDYFTQNSYGIFTPQLKDPFTKRSFHIPTIRIYQSKIEEAYLACKEGLEKNKNGN